MEIKVIKNARDHRKALRQVESLWDAKPNTPRGDQLELLTTLVEVYEERRHPIIPPDPVSAIKFRMEQEGLDNSDLARLVGGRNRVSEILHRKRPLSLEMIRNLNRKWHIPAESLI